MKYCKTKCKVNTPGKHSRRGQFKDEMKTEVKKKLLLLLLPRTGKQVL